MRARSVVLPGPSTLFSLIAFCSISHFEVMSYVPFVTISVGATPSFQMSVSYATLMSAAAVSQLAYGHFAFAAFAAST